MRQEFEERLETYTTALQNADQSERVGIKAEFEEWYDKLSEAEKNEFRPVWSEDLREAQRLTVEIKELLDELRITKEQEKREGLSASAS